MIRLEHCRKSFGPRLLFDDLSLQVNPGECLAVTGPSGCGKTTLLRLISGLESLDAGRILLRGEIVSNPQRRTPPHRRRLGFAFQDDLLWPHMTVRQHLEFVLGRRHPRVDELLEGLHLAPLAHAPAPQLSGGEARRVSLARACAAAPDILLLDEPLAHLDDRLCSDVTEWLRREIAGRTCLLVSHHSAEAAALAARECLLAR